MEDSRENLYSDYFTDVFKFLFHFHEIKMEINAVKKKLHKC